MRQRDEYRGSGLAVRETCRVCGLVVLQQDVSFDD